LFVNEKIKEKRKWYLDDIPWSAPKLISKGYSNGWSEERTKNGYYI
jgi:hypothetical protein